MLINSSSSLSIIPQRFIGGRSQSEIDSLVSSKTGGCTPLLIACRNGHYDVVQYLLKRCHADVEQCGSVIFDGETIENGEYETSFHLKSDGVWFFVSFFVVETVKVIIHSTKTKKKIKSIPLFKLKKKQKFNFCLSLSKFQLRRSGVLQQPDTRT